MGEREVGLQVSLTVAIEFNIIMYRDSTAALWFHYYSPKCQKKICLDKCFVNHLETFLWWFWAQINWFTKKISIFGSGIAFFVFLGFSGVSQGKMVIFALISPVNHPKSLLGGPWWVSRGFWVIYAKKKRGGAFLGKNGNFGKKSIFSHLDLLFNS